MAVTLPSMKPSQRKTSPGTVAAGEDMAAVVVEEAEAAATKGGVEVAAEEAGVAVEVAAATAIDP